MPLSKYYSGHGAKVMRAMKKEYGDEKGERVFYATANKMAKKRHHVEKKLHREDKEDKD